MAINMQNLLTQIFILYEKHKILENEQCLGFNIFSILNMERKEVETHSLFIYELLNPKGSHNQNEIFLDLFLKSVLDLEDYGEIINGAVRREDPTRHGRRIDFTIETRKYQIAIEMKIDADDQNEQLHDYYIEMEKRSRNIDGEKQVPKLYYLTLDGRKASDKSLGEDEKLKDSYEILSFSDNILNWIELCLSEVALKPVIRELLYQYKVVLEKITNKDKGLIMNTVKTIIQSKENFIAAYEIYQSYEDTATRLEKEFWMSLTTAIHEKCINGFVEKEITEDSVRNARKASPGARSEINVYFNIYKIDINNKVMLKVGYSNAEDGIYTTIYKEENSEWGKYHNEHEVLNALNCISFPFTLKKFNWAYGYAVIDKNVQLRNENLFEAKNEIDMLVQIISELVIKVRASIENEYNIK